MTLKEARALVKQRLEICKRGIDKVYENFHEQVAQLKESGTLREAEIYGEMIHKSVRDIETLVYARQLLESVYADDLGCGK